MTSLDLNGAQLYPGWLDRRAQKEMVEAVRSVVAEAPLFRPETRRGQKLSVRMTSAGDLGWVSDRHGYRYDSLHPSGQPWPAIPKSVFGIWHGVAGVDRDPDSCLVNFYDQDARMGLHQDRDEADLTWPVVSVSLGDTALFRIGGTSRGGKTLSQRLASGDVVVLAGPARLAYHGVDRIYPGTSELLAQGGRLNLTLRVAG